MAHFTLPGNEKQQAPSHVILDTRAMLLELMPVMMPYLEETESMPTRTAKKFWREDMDKVLTEIIQIIAFKKDAELSLQYESMQIVKESMQEQDAAQVIAYTRFLVSIGMVLVTKLQQIGAYTNGKLMYAYKCMQDENVVLEHVLFNPSNHEESSIST